MVFIIFLSYELVNGIPSGDFKAPEILMIPNRLRIRVRSLRTMERPDNFITFSGYVRDDHLSLPSRDAENGLRTMPGLIG